MSTTTLSGNTRIQKTFVGVYGPYEFSSTSLTFFNNAVYINDSPRSTVISGVSRIQRTEPKLLLGTSRIQRTETHNLFGDTRVQRTEHSDTSGITRVQRTEPKLLLGNTRIQRSELQTISGVSNMRYKFFIGGVLATTTGVARIKGVTSRVHEYIPNVNAGNSSISGTSSISVRVPGTNSASSKIAGANSKSL